MESLELKAKLGKVKRRISETENPVELVNNLYGSHPETPTRLATVKSKMADWRDPVEIVNNIYGSHPGDEGIDYFKRVFSFC